MIISRNAENAVETVDENGNYNNVFYTFLKSSTIRIWET